MLCNNNTSRSCRRKYNRRFVLLERQHDFCCEISTLTLKSVQKHAYFIVCCAYFSQQQDESARRHKENIDQIKEKAFEMTVLKHSTEDQKDAPKLAPYSTKKFCTVCNVLVRNSAALIFQLSPGQLCCLDAVLMFTFHLGITDEWL